MPKELDIRSPTGESFCTISVKISRESHLLDVQEAIGATLGFDSHSYRILSPDGTPLRESTQDFGDLLEAIDYLSLVKLNEEEAAMEQARIEALESVTHGHNSLKSVAAIFREDPEVVLAAAGEDVCNLRYASEAILSDPEIMAKAVKKSKNSIFYIADSLWEDPAFVREAVQVDGLSLHRASDPIRASKEIVLAAVNQNGLSLEYASAALQADIEVAMAAVEQHGTALVHASKELRANKQVVLAAVRNNKMAILSVDEIIRYDDDVQDIVDEQRSTLVEKPTRRKYSERVKLKFKEFDENGDGFLDVDELTKLLRKGNPKITDDEVQMLFENLDTDKNGRIDFDEFCDYVHGLTKRAREHPPAAAAPQSNGEAKPA